MDKLISEAIPFKTFKERIRIVKEIEKKDKNSMITLDKKMVIVQYSNRN